MVRKKSVCLLNICDMLLNERALGCGFENVETGQEWKRRVVEWSVLQREREERRRDIMRPPTDR